MGGVDPATVAALAPGFVVERVGDGGLLLGLERRCVAELNRSAFEALAKLDGARSIGDIASELSALFDASREQVSLDVVTLLDDLQRAGVVVSVEQRDTRQDSSAPDEPPARTPYAPTPGVVLCETGDGESFLVHPEREKLVALNSSAVAIWRACDGIRTAAGIAHLLWGALGGGPQVVREVAECLVALATLGLLSPAPTLQEPGPHGAATPGEGPAPSATASEVAQ